MARSHPENAHLHGKYHCTDDLLFILFGFSCFAYVEGTTCLVKIQTSQAGGQPYYNISPYGECSLVRLLVDPVVNLLLIKSTRLKSH